MAQPSRVSDGTAYRAIKEAENHWVRLVQKLVLSVLNLRKLLLKDAFRNCNDFFWRSGWAEGLERLWFSINYDWTNILSYLHDVGLLIVGMDPYSVDDLETKCGSSLQSFRFMMILSTIIKGIPRWYDAFCEPWSIKCQMSNQMNVWQLKLASSHE